MAKNKQELIDSICTAIDGADILFNPEHIVSIEHIGTCFGTQMENRIRSLKDRLGMTTDNCISTNNYQI